MHSHFTNLATLPSLISKLLILFPEPRLETWELFLKSLNLDVNIENKSLKIVGNDYEKVIFYEN